VRKSPGNAGHGTNTARVEASAASAADAWGRPFTSRTSTAACAVRIDADAAATRMRSRAVRRKNGDVEVSMMRLSVKKATRRLVWSEGGGGGRVEAIVNNYYSILPRKLSIGEAALGAWGLRTPPGRRR
jgi:hypothetical protein